MTVFKMKSFRFCVEKLNYFLFSENLKISAVSRDGWRARGDGFVTEHQTTGGTDAVHY